MTTAREQRMALIGRFAAEVATWPASKLRAGYAQPETIRRAEEREQNMKHNNPRYYTWHPAAPECYKVAQEFTYNLGNALTYIWRAGRKPGNSAVKDLQKAIDHLRFEIERLEAEGIEGPLSGLDNCFGVGPEGEFRAEIADPQTQVLCPACDKVLCVC